MYLQFRQTELTFIDQTLANQKQNLNNANSFAHLELSQNQVEWR